MSVIKLKRSSVIGKTPASSSLDFGELAINTKDGKIFLKRSGSGDTQTVWPVMVLGAQNTPMSGATTQLTSSFFINGTVSASAFIGDGSGLTNIPGANAFWTESGIGISRFSDVLISGSLLVSSSISASEINWDGGTANLTNFSSSTHDRLVNLENNLAVTGAFWTSSGDFIRRQSDVYITGTLRVSSDISASAVSASTYFGDGSGLTGIAGLWTASGDFIRRQSDVEITGTLKVSSTITASAYLGFEESLPILISGSFSDTQIPPIYIPTSMSFTNVQFALETGSCFIHVEVSGSTNGSLATGSITTQLPWGTINRITESVNRADEIVLKVTGSLSTEHLSVNLLFTRRN